MTGSQPVDMKAHIERFDALITRLRTQATSDAAALLRISDRHAVQQAIVDALRVLSDDPALDEHLARFAPTNDDRPMRAHDVTITLDLLRQALHAHSADG